MKTIVLALAALMSVACSHSKATPPPPNQLSPGIIREARDTELDSAAVWAALHQTTVQSRNVMPELRLLSGSEKTSTRSLNSVGRQWNAIAKSKCRPSKDQKKLTSGRDSAYETYTLKGAQCPVDFSTTSQTQADADIAADNTINGSIGYQIRESVTIKSSDLRKATGVSSSSTSIDGTGVFTNRNPTTKTGSVWSHGEGVMTNETSIGQIRIDLKLETYQDSAKSDLALVGVAHFGNEQASFSMLRLDGQTTFRIGGRLSTAEEFAKIFDANLAKLKSL